MSALQDRALLRVISLVGVLSGLVACERPPKPEVDHAQAREAVRTRASPAEREGCPAEVVPERALSLELFRLSDYCDKRLSWCAQQCFESDAKACYSLAQVFRRDTRYEALGDPLLYRSCAMGVMWSCTRRAYEMTVEQKGRGDDKVQACAARTYERTCAHDDGWGCALHATNLFTGKQVKQDWKKAREVAGRVCTSAPSEIVACELAKELLAELDKAEKTQKQSRSQR